MVYQRDQAIKNFKPEPYFELNAEILANQQKFVAKLDPYQRFKGSQHFFGQFAKRLFVKLGHTRKAMLLVQDSLSVLVPLRGCKRSRCKRRLALSDH